MNKTLLLSIVGVVVVVGGIGFYMMGGVPATGLITGENQETSLKELLASQTPQQCTFNHETDISKSSGEVFVVNGKMRGNFTSLAQGQTVKSYMIIDSATAYVWSDAMPQGFKMSVDVMTNAGNQNQAQNVDINQKLNYSCGSWSEDSSIFTPPASVSFSDMTDLMKQIPQVSTDGAAGAGVGAGAMQAACGQCDQIPDAAGKAQCRTALQCK